MRPMADNRESMTDLKRILEVREPLYRKADATIDTSAITLEEAVDILDATIRGTESA